LAEDRIWLACARSRRVGPYSQGLRRVAGSQRGLHGRSSEVFSPMHQDAATHGRMLLRY